MNFVLGVFLLWVGGALIWVATHNRSLTGPADIWKTVTDEIGRT